MWEQVDIAGRVADVYCPEPGPWDAAVIYLHGFAEESLREDPVLPDLFAQHRLPVVCPTGGKSWWLDVPAAGFSQEETPMRYVSQQVTSWIADAWNVLPPRIALLGVSVGGQGALNLAYRQALRFPVVAALSPAIDFDQLYGRGFGIEDLFPSAEAARQETPVLHLHPLNWPKHQFFCSDPADRWWHAGSERLASKLNSSGVPFASDLQTSAGGHGWPYFHQMAPRAIEFLARSLRE